MRLTVALLSGFLAFLTLAADDKTDDKAVRAVIERLFATYTKKDLDGFMALWSKQSPDFASRKQTMKRIFAETGDITVQDLTVVQVEVKADSARVLLRVELVGNDKRSGKLHADLGKFTRLLSLRRQEDGWKILRYGSLEDDLMLRLLQADGKEAREKLYQDNKDLVGRPLIDAAFRLLSIAQRQGHYDAAFRFNDLAIEIAERLSDRPSLARCYTRRAFLSHEQFDYPAVRTSSQRALELFRETKDRQGEARSLNNLGALCEITSRYAEALAYYQDSLKIARELGERKDEAITLHNVGLIYSRTGRYAEALRYSEDSLTILRELKDREGEAGTLVSIGNVYSMTGRYAEALRTYHDALKLARELGDRAAEGQALNNIGELYHVTGRDTEALRNVQDSLTIRRERGDRKGEMYALLNLGGIFFLSHRMEEALEPYQQTLTLARKLGSRDMEGAALNALGRLYSETGHPAEAVQSIKDGLAIQREVGDRDGEASTLVVLANTYRKSKRFDEALETARAALQLSESIGSPTAKTSWTIGDIYRDRREWDKAATAYRQAIHWIEQLRDRTWEQSLQTGLAAEYSLPYRHLAGCLLELGQPAEAFAVAEQSKARTLVSILQTGKTDIHTGMSAEQRQKEQQRQEEITGLAVELEDLRSHKANPKHQKELDGKLGKERQDYEAFRRDLFLRLPELQVRRAEFAPVALTELNRALFAAHPKLVILSYLSTKEETLLFVLTRGEKVDGPATLAIHRIAVPIGTLAEAVETFREGCARPGIRPTSEDLYNWLLGPAEEMLARASQVVIVPDAALHQLPFQALRADEEGAYLIERCAVSYAPSLTALVEMHKQGERRRQQFGKEGSLLAVGISDFGEREKRLPAAEAEAKAAAAPFGDQGRTLLGPAATRTRLQEVWSKARYLHFATHGILNEQVPLYSSIVLSQEKGKRDEGQLFAHDLSELDTDLAAELAVLSACESGLGRQSLGEGLQGLSWAWFVAGVPSLVVSQWKIGDNATEKLMTVFWQEIKAGTPKAEALRKAQLSLLKERQTRHPFFWAPFVLVGDFGP